MKANPKNILGLAVLGMTLLATTVPTWAGYVSDFEVVVANNQYFHYGRGSMVDARYSADSTQYINCEFDTGWLITCRARDKAGNTVLCYSQDPTHVAELQGMTDSSYIYFSMNPGSSLCNLIVVTNSSDMLK